MVLGIVLVIGETVSITAVRVLSDAIKAERGVRFAETNLISFDLSA